MNKRSLLILGAVLLALAVVFFSTNPDTRNTKPAAVQLFADLDGEKLGKLELEKGKDKVELRLKDNVWTVPARDDYRADYGKVRSFLLKLLELTVTQQVPGGKESFEALGVADNNTEKGFSKVSLLTADNNELSGLYIGDNRKQRKNGPPTSGVGQYVRKVGTEKVYLVSEPLYLSVTPQEWLETELVNIPASKVRGIKQTHLTAGAEEKDFELVTKRDGQGARQSGKFELSEPLTAGEELQEPVISQIGAGLENARMEDVHAAKTFEETNKEVAFDRRSYFETQNGLIYTVDSAEHDGKYYLKVAVRFDSELAKTIQDEIAKKNEQLKKEKEEKEKQQTSSQAAQENSSSSSFEPIKAELSTAGEAEKINAALSQWIYEVAKYQADRFRHTLADVVKTKTEGDSSSASSEG